MNYLILLLFLIIFIISLYFLIRLRSRQDLVINKSTFIAVSLITGSSAVGLAVSLNIQDPIDSAKLNDTRKNFQNVFLDRDNYKSKIQCHSTVPFDSLTKSVDSLMKYKPQYNSSARSQFNFICMELAYNDQTAIQKIEVLKKNQHTLNKYYDYYKINPSNPLKDTLLKNNLIARINMAYAIVHNDTLLKDTFQYKSPLNAIKVINTKFDFGNLCPPECDDFEEDPLLFWYIKNSKDSIEMSTFFGIKLSDYTKDGHKIKTQ